MKSQNNVEVQAILNLLYIGDDEDGVDMESTLPSRGLGSVGNNQNKVKSNTMHLRTDKNMFSKHNSKT